MEPQTLRQKIEANILGVNKYLKDAVKQMTCEELLANCHPAERHDYAWKLYRVGELSWVDLQRISPKKELIR